MSDFVTRGRVTGLHLDYHVLEQNALVSLDHPAVRSGVLVEVTLPLCQWTPSLAPGILGLLAAAPSAQPKHLALAVTSSERVRLRALMDAIVAVMFGLDHSDLRRVMRHCDLPRADIPARSLDPKGFWRTDRDRDPELRRTILALAAFESIASKMGASNSHRNGDLPGFLTESEGWLLPETLRLTDHGLGHDDRAQRHQPVARRMGPRFHDYQLVQGAHEPWRAMHLHARNLIGRLAYAQFLEGLIAHRSAADDSHHDLLFGEFTRDLVRRPPGCDLESTAPSDWASRGRGVLAGEPRAEYGAKRPQADLLPQPQTDMFE